MVPAIARASDQTDALLTAWVAGLRRRRVPWSEIGEALGVTRQAAWERFHGTEPDEADSPAESPKST